MVLIITLIIYLLVLLGEIVPMIKNEQWKEIRVYLSIYFFSIVLSVLLIQDVKIPSPAKGIEKLLILIIGNR